MAYDRSRTGDGSSLPESDSAPRNFSSDLGAGFPNVLLYSGTSLGEEPCFSGGALPRERYCSTSFQDSKTKDDDCLLTDKSDSTFVGTSP